MLKTIDFPLLTCPHCNHTGVAVHAYYERTVRAEEEPFRLVVVRVICSSCGKTHAILPDTLVPYSSITMQDTIDIIMAETPAELDEILTRNIHLHLTELYRVKANYRRYWKERLFSFGIALDDVVSYHCIKQFHRQFMQIPCTLCGQFQLTT